MEKLATVSLSLSIKSFCGIAYPTDGVFEYVNTLQKNAWFLEFYLLNGEFP